MNKMLISDPLGSDIKYLLPESAQLIVTLIGLPKATRLIEELRGTTFPIPKRQTRMGEIRFEMLAEVVGYDAAVVLTRHFGGESLYVPRCVSALRELRNRQLRIDFDSMSSENSAVYAVSALARRYDLSDRQIWSILKSIEKTEAKEDFQINLL